MNVSIVIPVWRDEGQLRTLLADRGLAPAAEIIVAAPSDEIDDLTELVRNDTRVRLVASPPGRSQQMNAGAASASGDWLLFLHGDSRLPADWLHDIAAADRNSTTVGGAFRFALDSRDPRARLIEWGVRHRVRWFNLPYGDQGLFVRRTVFEAVGGYAPLPIMEDVDLVQRLRRRGRLYCARRPMTTSARRWERDGWIRRTVTNWSALAAYAAGVPPARIVRWYEKRRSEVAAVLARDPQSLGKSRLWRELHAPPDRRLLEALLADTLAAVERAPDIDRLLVHTGRRGAMTAFCPPGWTTLPQRGEDLGERMAYAFDDLFARGHARVVLVGSDLPTLPERAVRRAFWLLRRGADLVLGPAEDGGFYLIGLRKPRSALFQHVQWGTSQVLEEAVKRASALRLTVRLVDRWYDVDDVASLRRAASDGRAIHTSAWWRARSVV